jgi:hypothetical protein
VLTSTDIPPGGEGKIEVTFDSNHKTGEQKKTVTVESNDPGNPHALLNISAVVEIVFGFEQYSLDFGKLRKGQPISVTTTMRVKDPSIRKTITFTASSPQITAVLVEPPAGSNSEPGKLTVEVSGSAEMPPGKIGTTLTASAGNDSVPDATLQIQGTVIGNLDVSPDIVQFHVDTSKSDAEVKEQVVKVVSVGDEVQLQLLKIEDANQNLKFHVDTLLAGKQYDITIKPKPTVLSARKNVVGTLTITTDDKDQPVMSVTYFVSFGR